MLDKAFDIFDKTGKRLNEITFRELIKKYMCTTICMIFLQYCI